VRNIFLLSIYVFLKVIMQLVKSINVLCATDIALIA
jgi:hypothetical protein